MDKTSSGLDERNKSDDYCWQIGKTMTESSLYMLEYQIRCDLTLKLKTTEGIGKSIGVHTFILTSRSPVFDTMFSERWRKSEDDAITIDDVNYDLMYDFLRYLYTDECEILASNALGLQYLSRKYMAGQLEERCELYLSGEIGVDNCSTLLQQSIAFQDKETLKLCMSFIKDNTVSVFHSKDFLHLEKDGLSGILRSDILCCPEGEQDVYYACVRWAKVKCLKDTGVDMETLDERDLPEVPDEQIRKKLGDCLHLIRLPSLPAAAVIKILSGSEIISYTEKGMIHEYVHTREPLKDMPFPCKPRKFSLRINRFDFPYSILYTTSLVTNPKVDAIKFIANKEILLYGVTFQASECGRLPTGLLKLTIGSEASEAQLHGGSQRKLGVKFPTRRIIANQPVTLEVIWDKPETDDIQYRYPVYFDQRGYEPSRVCVPAPDGTIFSFLKADVDDNCSTVTHGQFPQLMFFSTSESGPPFIGD